jgi:hypothetical protein
MDRFLVKSSELYNFNADYLRDVRPQPESMVLSSVMWNWGEVQVWQVELPLLAEPGRSPLHGKSKRQNASTGHDRPDANYSAPGGRGRRTSTVTFVY